MNSDFIAAATIVFTPLVEGSEVRVGGQLQAPQCVDAIIRDMRLTHGRARATLFSLHLHSVIIG